MELVNDLSEVTQKRIFEKGELLTLKKRMHLEGNSFDVFLRGLDGRGLLLVQCSAAAIRA